MSVVTPVPGTAPTGARRRVLPTLCASLLALPLIALPTVAGTALADEPAAPVADAAVEQAPAEVVEVDTLPQLETAQAETAEAAEAETAEAETAEAETAEAETAAVAPAGEPVVLETEEPADAAGPEAATGVTPVVPDEKTGNPGPMPDDVERPDLVVGLTGPASGWPGGEGAYTMTVANAATATSPAKGFTVVYTAPPGQTVLSVDTPLDAAWACALSVEASCTWSGELAVGQAAPPITVIVGHGRRAASRLTGTAKADFLEGEVVLADNTATVVTAMQAPDLALTVGAPDAVSAGEAITMVLSVTNIGPGWVSSFALHGDVTDGVVVESMAGQGFACDVATLRCDYSDELAPGLSAAVTVTGVVAPSHAGGPLTTSGQIDQGLLMASAVTAVSAAPRPAAGAPVAAAPQAAPAKPAAPAPARPAAPAKAVTPIAVAPVSKPVTTTRALPLPRAVSNTRPQTLAFTDEPTALPFTGSRSGSQLAGGIALLLLGVGVTMGARRRTA